MRLKLLAVAAFFALAGGAYAAETPMKMDCCKNCPCCKEKAPAPKEGEQKPQSPPQQPTHQH